MSKNILILFFLIMLLYACASALRVPTETDAERGRTNDADVTLLSLHEGHKLYINNCSGCHHLYLPESYTPAQWDSLFPEMAEEAHLNEKDARMIFTYLKTMCIGDMAKSSSVSK
jgi:hypothetical protein